MERRGATGTGGPGGFLHNQGHYIDTGESFHVTRPGLSIAVIFLASACVVLLILNAFPELDEWVCVSSIASVRVTVSVVDTKQSSPLYMYIHDPMIVLLLQHCGRAGVEYCDISHRVDA